MPAPSTVRPRWLLLIQQLPTRPSSARIKTWRRLQQIGSVLLKNSVYILPHTPQAREDFEWLCSEIRAANGQASVLAAEALTGEQEEEIRHAFREARTADYEALRGKARELSRRIPGSLAGSSRQGLQRSLRMLRDELVRVQSIDFCGSPARTAAEEMLDKVASKLTPKAVRTSPARAKAHALKPGVYRRRIWVTRPRPGVDRIASAWLIDRFIDSSARFAFVNVEAAQVPKGQVPFDMFGAEFGHQGHRCTFETLCERFGLDEPALRRIGEIVHEVDLKDRRYDPAEAPVIATVIEGLRAGYKDDGELLQHGMALFGGLYESFRQSEHPRGRTR
jgi:hypothetical protein